MSDESEVHATPLPALGAPVHYRSYGTPGGEYSSVCRAAMVTGVGGWRDTGERETPGEGRRWVEQVWEPDRCDVRVFNPSGDFYNACSYDRTAQAGGTWHWPGACR